MGGGCGRYMIVNGATKHDDMKHLDAQLAGFKGDVKYQYFHEQQLIALQVPIHNHT